MIERYLNYFFKDKCKLILYPNFIDSPQFSNNKVSAGDGEDGVGVGDNDGNIDGDNDDDVVVDDDIDTNAAAAPHPDHVNDADDAAVSSIVNAINTSNISSISDNSTNESGTVSVSSLDTLPMEHQDGLYDATSFTGMSFLHSYGAKNGCKKLFFNVYKFIKSRHTKKVVNIKVQDYIIFKDAMKCKTRFVFAGIVCKYTDYLKYHSNPTHKLTSKYLV